jgi:acetyl-CoA acetyltransferase
MFNPSGQQAIHFGCQAIASGDMDLMIAGGIEVGVLLSFPVRLLPTRRKRDMEREGVCVYILLISDHIIYGMLDGR